MKEKHSEIRDKLGQLLMLDFRNWGVDAKGEPIPFTLSNNTVEDIIKKYNLGGIALFKENTINPGQTIRLIKELQGAAEIPILIGIDQEGGIVTRLQSGTDMPGNMILGAAREADVTRKVAKAIGEELYCQGINLDFAPDIDVNSNPKNPIIGVRSFGSSPELVSILGNAYIDGLREASVLSCAKHFPGHGNTATDTHLGLAVVGYSIEDLDKIDLAPFKASIKAGTDTIMVAHVIVPALDNAKVKSKKDGKLIGTPATLSYPIITELLKKKMGFEGLILTDALDMKAISDNFGNEEATVKTILAGSDMAVMPVRIWGKKDIPKLEKLIETMEAEYNSNAVFKTRVEESYNRIISFKKKHKLKENTFAEMDVQAYINKADKIVGCRKHHDIEDMASASGITLLKNENKILPFKINDGCKILITDTNSLRLRIAKEEIENLSKYNDVNVKVSVFKADYKSKLNSELKSAVLDSDLCIILTYNLNNSDIMPEMIAAFARKHSVKSVSISCRNPYDIAFIPEIDSNICIYGAVGFDQTNYKQSILQINLVNALRAVFLDTKSGKVFTNPKGKLPVDIPSVDNKETLYHYGFGLNY